MILQPPELGWYLSSGLTNSTVELNVSRGKDTRVSIGGSLVKRIPILDSFT